MHGVNLGSCNRSFAMAAVGLWLVCKQMMTNTTERDKPSLYKNNGYPISKLMLITSLTFLLLPA